MDIANKHDKVKPCDQACSKCGSLDIYRHFYNAKSGINRLGDTEDFSYAYIEKTSRSRLTVKEDCILHTCRCCGYSWDTKPL